ncbi:uncharacterized protein SPPG_07087 [Spizellomyces punctatus DAOM BR117]|uniref:C2H2-type domain-containing protein n=1 Tax=Spizellomyces punctatus (strain DAOM BR117) TaxID=645134 RepID=A0A0L0H9P5_SPIPD|nr:uncharacterized protein SPPG_07087 [Spizellomyces punctatus DAOM BR117]KNC97619.1 hypothetical protein SPPG_07087 [Spizellomyces punctatus DAOM BR117]|eukprot:XP_016605659.1 hypothetical protein SPPG_07087 [Spizellomyces punctatus DAOM BR117]
MRYDLSYPFPSIPPPNPSHMCLPSWMQSSHDAGWGGEDGYNVMPPSMNMFDTCLMTTTAATTTYPVWQMTDMAAAAAVPTTTMPWTSEMDAFQTPLPLDIPYWDPTLINDASYPPELQDLSSQQYPEQQQQQDFSWSSASSSSSSSSPLSPFEAPHHNLPPLLPSLPLWNVASSPPPLPPPPPSPAAQKVRTFHCQTCPKSFARKQDLKRHIVTHMPGYKPFRCYNCGTGFTRSDAVHRHLKARRCM